MAVLGRHATSAGGVASAVRAIVESRHIVSPLLVRYRDHVGMIDSTAVVASASATALPSGVTGVLVRRREEVDRCAIP